MNARQPGRARNAERARSAILASATALFAAHGFGATHMRAIAEASGYDKSLLFQYFSDKLGLYTTVVEHVIQQALPSDTVAALAALLADEATPRDLRKLTTLLATLIRSNFDILRVHPVTRQLLTWEAAEGWQTFKRIYQTYVGPGGAGARLPQLIREAQAAGLIDPDLDMAVVLTFVQECSRVYLTELPRLQLVLEELHLSTDAALTRAREHLVRVVLRGILVAPLALQAT